MIYLAIDLECARFSKLAKYVVGTLTYFGLNKSFELADLFV
jgi:hypothetical protein